MTRAWVIGNGKSLNETPLELLRGERTYAVNRIWKLFDITPWRPTDYVRSELPVYDGGMVAEDLRHMQGEDCRIWVQAGFFRYCYLHAWGRPVIPFITCNARTDHAWHLPEICGYGTVVQIAMQLAIVNGADEINLLGCDLGTEHFYPEEEFKGMYLSIRAFEHAKENSPVPIYNCTVGGDLNLFPRRDIREVLRG